MSTSAAPAVPPPRDRLARLLMALNAALALVAGVLGAGAALAAPEGQIIVEWWRALGFLVFSALWLVVALRPRGAPGAWEVILVHKTAMVVVAGLTGAVGAGEVIAVDGYLAVSTLGAYLACRGWLGWRPVAAERPIAWDRADTP